MVFHENPTLIRDLKDNNATAIALHETLIARGSRAIAYLEARGVTKQTIASFKLGYYPKDSDQGAFTIDLPGEARIPDGLKGSVSIPIYDPYGYCVAISFRPIDLVPGSKTPKYYNTRFSKKHYLYNMARAKETILQKDLVIIVEGYFDVMALDRVGIYNVVATMGTAFGEEKAWVLARYCSSAVIIADNDEPGAAAAAKIEAMLNEAPWNIDTVVKPPPGSYKDIDEFLRGKGPEAVKVLRYWTSADIRSIAKPEPLNRELLLKEKIAAASIGVKEGRI